MLIRWLSWLITYSPQRCWETLVTQIASTFRIHFRCEKCRSKACPYMCGRSKRFSGRKTRFHQSNLAHCAAILNFTDCLSVVWSSLLLLPLVSLCLQSLSIGVRGIRGGGKMIVAQVRWLYLFCLTCVTMIKGAHPTRSRICRFYTMFVWMVIVIRFQF